MFTVLAFIGRQLCVTVSNRDVLLLELSSARLSTTGTLMRSNAQLRLERIISLLLELHTSTMLGSVLSFVLLFSFGTDFNCVAAAGNQSNAETCHEVYPVSGCSTHKNCTTVTCALNFTEQSLRLTVDIYRCEGMVATTSIVNIPDESSRYWHMFSDPGVETVQLPGFPNIQWEGFLYVGVNLRVSLTNRCGLFWVKVELLVGGDLADGGNRFPVRKTVLYGLFSKVNCEFQDYEQCDDTDDSFLPPESDYSLSQLLQILLPTLSTTLLFTFMCCCYHWCRRCHSNTTEDAVRHGTAATLRDLVTMRMTDIPMEQLVNEMEGSAKV